MPILRSRAGANNGADIHRSKPVDQSSMPPPSIEPATPSIGDAPPDFPSSAATSRSILDFSSSVSAVPRRRSIRIAALAVPSLSNAFDTSPCCGVAKRGFDVGIEGSEGDGERKDRVLGVVEGDLVVDGEIGMVSSMCLRSGSRIGCRKLESDRSVSNGVRKDRGKGKTVSSPEAMEGKVEIGIVAGDLRLNVEEASSTARGESKGKLFEEFVDMVVENSDNDDAVFEQRRAEKSKVERNIERDIGKSRTFEVNFDIEPCKFEEGVVGSKVTDEKRDVSSTQRKRGRPMGRSIAQNDVRERKIMKNATGYGLKDQSLVMTTDRNTIEQQEEAGDKYINLRSGSRISRRIMTDTEEDSILYKGGAGTDCKGSEGYDVKGKLHVEGLISEMDKHHLVDRQNEISAMDIATTRKIYTRSKRKNKLVDKEGTTSSQAEVYMDINDSINYVQEHLVNDNESESKTRPEIVTAQIVSRREADRSKAMELAPKFAFFQSEEHGNEEGEEELLEELVGDTNLEDWPGPFSTAMKIIEERDEKLKTREISSSKKNENNLVKIPWVPSKGKGPLARLPLTLRELCLKVLADNAEEIESLDGVPDVLRHKLISMLCHGRKMSSRFLNHIINGSPTEITLSDCSWGSEGEFKEILSQCNLESLKVLQLDLSGRCMPDYVVGSLLAKSFNYLPSLTKLSLEAAYRLSDNGLDAIVSSAPLLSSINISKCSLLTSSGIANVAHKLNSVLKELYIDHCTNVNPMMILPALQNAQCLEVLSMAGIQSVSDIFVRRLVCACGSNMRKLVFAGCQKLTNASIKAIAENCSSLSTIDIQELCRLDDYAIAQLANGCLSLQNLKLRRNKFSDEAVAAFLEASGGSLIELCLNNVQKVAHHSALAIFQRCSVTLETLDLSFCRNVTDEALGLIVDSCSNLKTLKIFGCTQVTNLFLSGHSNSVVRIITGNGQILEGIEIPGCF